MSGPLAVLAGLFLVGGVIGLVIGLRRSHRPAPAHRSESLANRWARLSRRPAGAAGRRRDVVLVVSMMAGFVVASISGWVISIALIPALALGLPYLLSIPSARDVELLEALDRWVRALAATLTTGKSIPDAIRISRRTAPPLIAAEVNMLVVRLNNRWETRDALRRFADGLDSPDADAVVAALMLAANRGANGASTTLHALADSIQSQLKGRRMVEVERAKPYAVVRQVTVISLVTVALVYLSAPAFFDPYRTPVGQLILAVLIVGYIASLVLMRRKARAERRMRILIGQVT